MRNILAIAVATTLGLGTTAQAKAIAIAIPQPRQLAVQAEVIIVGKVVDIEKDLVEVEPFPKSGQKVGYHVASIKISESLVGAKGITNLRVGWQPAPKTGPATDDVPIRRPIRPFPGVMVNLAKDQEGLFFLQKHPSGEFYSLVQFSQPIDKKNPNFAKEVELVKKITKVLDNPMEALKSKDAAERQNAVTTLMTKYRQYPQIFDGKPAKQEEIPADESKLILSIMAEMEWGKFDPETGSGLQNIFYQLDPQRGTPEGFVQPKFDPAKPVQPQDFNKIMGEAVKKWLDENKDKYRVKKYVASK